jgi:hypothetical protein
MVITSVELQRLQVQRASFEQLHVVAVGIGNRCTNTRAGFDNLAEQVL